ncbi:methyltransferase domain-containing protein [Lentisphaerota bacterium ZTH]|nr:class I SAM-dependent methyltransferase [Lentisphaerota bacterium]WET05210.1 methyltransferase domain-containing protein [Lentisphaerota bacterium ZTH]
MSNSPNQTANASFYNNISSLYDSMFPFEKLLKKGEKLITELKKRFMVSTLLDTGCGTGAYTVAAARCGCKATGADIAEEMLAGAKKNAESCNTAANFILSSMEALPCNLDETFDAVLCMGNTVPHIFPDEYLFSALKGCRQSLSTGGHLIITLLNYAAILKKRERIVGISKSGDYEFIRFYDFEDPYVNFNIMTINWSGQKPVSHLSSTRLFPYQYTEMKKYLHDTGFEKIELYGGTDFSKFSPDNSSHVMLIAERS